MPHYLYDLSEYKIFQCSRLKFTRRFWVWAFWHWVTGDVHKGQNLFVLHIENNLLLFEKAQSRNKQKGQNNTIFTIFTDIDHIYIYKSYIHVSKACIKVCFYSDTLFLNLIDVYKGSKGYLYHSNTLNANVRSNFTYFSMKMTPSKVY